MSLWLLRVRWVLYAKFILTMYSYCLSPEKNLVTYVLAEASAGAADAAEASAGRADAADTV
jgi:hypothetical protein